MRNFDYARSAQALLTPEICNLLAELHEYRGKQELFATARKDVLESLQTVAVIQSTDSSNRIEGIFTSGARLKKLIMEKAEPVNRDEREIAGYRDVLATIHGNYEFIPMTPNTILQLHRDLYAFQAAGTGGHWKNSDNIIAQTDSNGESHVRFMPVSAFETPDAMERLCRNFSDSIAQRTFDPLLLSLLFVFDFLCIHPFPDGNGRMSRLLTLLLLYRQRYMVGKYISVEMLIEKSKKSYYEALQASSVGWEDESNDYTPFLRYMLGIILKAYREFEGRVALVVRQKAAKTDRIRLLFEEQIGKLAKADIALRCPDISISMIELTLKKLQTEGMIVKVGKGKNTAYIKRNM